MNGVSPLAGPGTGTSRMALVLAGGNALGAYLAGAYEQLHRRGVRPDWIVGASIGAVTGAIIAGNAAEDRIERLAAFWAEAATPTIATETGGTLRQIQNGLHTMLAAAMGRPGLFRHRYPGIWSILPGMPRDVALYDHAPLRRTVERLVDFDRLNRAEVRFTAACVDIETGEDVYFDNLRDEITPDHLLASAALAPVFPPVEIGGRVLCDPGYACNLPLDPVFDPPPERDLVCIAVDLFSLASPRPATLDATLERAQDILFASAPRRSIKALQREYGLREALRADGPRIRLAHLAYRPAGHELAAKAFDYSPASIRDRWAAGREDMAGILDRLGEAATRPGRFQYLTTERPPERAAAASPSAAG